LNLSFPHHLRHRQQAILWRLLPLILDLSGVNHRLHHCRPSKAGLTPAFPSPGNSSSIFNTPGPEILVPSSLSLSSRVLS
uniref:Ovule protein n=1 Tax=Haemonchus placei TaxID=6290 RepID=A0A0N4W2G3_HAEPC